MERWKLCFMIVPRRRPLFGGSAYWLFLLNAALSRGRGLFKLQLLLCLLQHFFFSWSIQGVDYNGMAHSNEFGAYIKHTAELQRVKLEGMTREETLAFFINIYNALVIHANVVRGPPVNLWQRYKVRIQIIISNYWIRLSVIWKIMQIKEGVRPWGRAIMKTTGWPVINVFTLVK